MAQPDLRARADGERGYQQALGQPVELEATVEAIGDAAEVQGQKPRRQGQLGVLKQGAGDQRGLLAAGAALEDLGHAHPELDTIHRHGTPPHVDPGHRMRRGVAQGVSPAADSC